MDIFALPVNAASSQEEKPLPGLLVCPAPRRCERSRTADLLTLLLLPTGSGSLPDGEVEEALGILIGTYYSSRGSVTAGMRAAVEDLNATLLDRNLARGSAPLAVSLSVAVLRGDQLTLAEAGPAHNLLIGGNGLEDFFEASPGRGLGVSKTCDLRYHLARVQPDDLLVMCPALPSDWAASLPPGSGQSIDHMRRRLLSQPIPGMQAAILQFKPGTGAVHRLRARVSVPPVGETAVHATPDESKRAGLSIQPGDEPFQRVQLPVEQVKPFTQLPDYPEFPAPPADFPPGVLPSTPEAGIPPRDDLRSAKPAPPPKPDKPAEGEASPTQTQKWHAPGRISQPAGSSSAPRAALAQEEPGIPPRRPSASPTGAAVTTRPAVPRQMASKPARPRGGVRTRLAALWLKGGEALQRFNDRLKKFATKLLPGTAERQPVVSTATLVFIAVAIPVAVVAIATTMYFRSGRSEQHMAYLAQAQQMAAQAQAASDITLQRNAWEQALTWLDKSEKYGTTPESIALRQQVQGALDVMDGVTRLVLEPAISGGFLETVNITKMVATSSDVYLLDATAGRVLRLMLTGSGYMVDEKFSCAPGVYNNITVGTLVDMVTIPPNNSAKAILLAIDGSGHLLYCGPDITDKEGKSTSVSPVIESPGAGWGDVRHMTFDQGILYIMDVTQNGIWMYYNTPAGPKTTPDWEEQTSAPPRLIFDDYIPVLDDTSGMAIYTDQLFLLHQGGLLTQCTLRGPTLEKTSCDDPALFSDQRPGYASDQAIFAGTKFTHLQVNEPPDPSLYILDSAGGGLYHFSLRLNLQQVLKWTGGEDFSLPKTAPTSFLVAPGRVLLVAFANQVYFGYLP